MAEHFEGQKILIKLGDGGAPEVFTHSCLINTTREVKVSANMVEEEVFDCNDPDIPAVVYRLKRSVKLDISGAGKLKASSMAAWHDWAKNDTAINCIVVVGFGSAAPMTLTGQMKCSEASFSGDAKGLSTGSVALGNHGDWTRT